MISIRITSIIISVTNHRLYLFGQKYKVPLEEASKKKGKEILPKEYITDIFGNIEEIKNISKGLLAELTDQSTSSEVMGKIFVEMVCTHMPVFFYMVHHNISHL